jgi:hypothetical protein
MPDHKEITKSLQRAHCLATMMDAEILWVRDFLKDDAKAIANKAKSSCNHLKKTIENSLSPEAKLLVEEKGFAILEKLLKEI